jgi:hypothetical protein
MISDGCFRNCGKLSNLTFQPRSKLSTLGKVAFPYCSSLHLICLPSSIETVFDARFARCTKQLNLTFESGSKIPILAESAFANCSSPVFHHLSKHFLTVLIMNPPIPLRSRN